MNTPEQPSLTRKPAIEVHIMVAHHSKHAGQVPAVAYLRRSTSRQEKSLVDQRTEIEQYAAANGYHILRWFQDDGIRQLTP